MLGALSPMIGDKLADRYEVLAEVGQGGMGVVYRARDQVLGREVAIKVIAGASNVSDQTEQRFRSEAQTIAQLDHPSIVAIYDFGRHRDALFYVMPLLEGRSLAAMIQGRELETAAIVEIGIAVADALAYTHAREIIHRDIKPENIMVSGEPSRPRITVMDFGLAKSAHDDPLTKTGILIGTVTYLSPEQVAGRVADAASDIYSFGTVLYECLAHTPPFVGETQAVLYRIVHEFPQSLGDRGIAVDSDLAALVMSCLRKAPNERPASMAALARLLRQLRRRLATGELGEATRLTTPLSGGSTIPFIGRHHELASLQKRLNRAISGEGHCVLIGGAIGVGKSRLLEELETLAAARGLTVLHGNLAEQASPFPYFGFCEVIVDYFKGRPGTGEVHSSSSSNSNSHTNKNKNRNQTPDLGDLAGELVALFPTLGELQALRGAPPAPAPGDPRAIFELLARALIRLTARGPLLILLESLEAAGASLDALHYVIRRLTATPVLLVASYHSDAIDRSHPLRRLVDDLRGSRRFAHLELGALEEAEHRELLSALLGEATLSEATSARLFAATAGNPAVTEAVIRAVVREGATSAEAADAVMMLRPSQLARALPPAVQAVVERRTQALGDELLEVLRVAAVLGRSFDARDLEGLVRGTGDLDDALDQLIDANLLEEGHEARGDRLAFKSGLVREVLYAQLPRRRRRSLHRRLAEHLERRHRNHLERIYAELLHHYAEGDLAEPAVTYGLLEGRRALGSFRPEEASRAVRIAQDFLDDEWTGEPTAIGEAHEILARAHQMAGELEAALREITAAIAEFHRLGAAAPELRALHLAAQLAWQARRTEDTRRWVELGIAAARALDDRETLRPLLSLAATLAGLRGADTQARALLDEAAGLRADNATGELSPTVGGRLVVALVSPSVASEPAAIQTQEDAEVLANVFETLVVTDDDGLLLPGLAESWEASADPPSFRFTLRRGVQFHDGAPLDAAAVIASLERLATLRAQTLPPALAVIAGIREFLAGDAPTIAGLTTPSPEIVAITLTAPLPLYPVLLATPAAAIVRQSVAAAATGARAAGTGPFKLAELGVRAVVIERFAEHWRRPPRLDAIEFRFVEGAEAMAQGLRCGELDIIRELNADDLDLELHEHHPVGVSIERPVKLTYFAIFNTASGPLARNHRLRRALIDILPVEPLVWQHLGRLGIPAAGLIPPGLLGYDPGRRRSQRTLEDAKDLLQGSGVDLSRALRVLVSPVILERFGAFFTALCDRWAALGLDIELVRLDVATFIAKGTLPPAIDVVFLRWGADYDDPDDFAYGTFHSEHGRWRDYFSSEAGDRLLERGRAEGEATLREAHYRDFEALCADAAAIVPLFHAVDGRLVAPTIRGMRLRSSPPFVNYDELSKGSDPQRRDDPTASALRVPIRGSVDTLDPLRGGYAECHEVLSTVFESLTRRVGGAQIVPWLAESIETAEGGCAYHIRLRRGITFHDGRRMTSRDVRYSFERMLQRTDATSRRLYTALVGADELLAGTAHELTGLELHSDYELTFRLLRPLVYVPGLLSHSVCAIIPEGADLRHERWMARPVGTGPFRVVHFDPGHRLELERAPNYWRPGIPRSRGLTFHLGCSPAEIRSGFVSGRYALAGELLPEDLDALRRDPTYASGYRETPSFATYFIVCNTHRGPLADPALRRLIADAIDRPRLARQSLGRQVKPAQGLIPPELLGAEAHLGEGHRAVDTPQAGIRDLELVCLVHHIFLSEYRTYYRRLCETLSALGIRLKIFDGAYNLYDLPDSQQKIDLTITRWLGDFPDAHTFCGTLHSREGVFGSLLGGERIDRLLERAQVTADPQARHGIYRQIEETIADEAALIPLFHPQNYRFARPQLAGLEVFHDGPVVAYEELYLRDGDGTSDGNGDSA